MYRSFELKSGAAKMASIVIANAHNIVSQRDMNWILQLVTTSGYGVMIQIDTKDIDKMPFVSCEYEHK